MADLVAVRLLVFRIGEVAVAADVAAVREILPAQPATRIPGAHAAVAGLINVRGSLVTLVDGRRALGPAAGGGGDATRADGPVVLLDVGGKVVGFAVDDVLDLVGVRADELAPRDDLPGLDPRLVRAVGRRGQQSFVLLDLEALLGPILTS